MLLPFFLNWELPAREMFVFDVLVQLGTLVAVIIYLRKELLSIISGFFKQLFAGKPFATHEARMGWLLIVATIPAGLAGLSWTILWNKPSLRPCLPGLPCWSQRP